MTTEPRTGASATAALRPTGRGAERVAGTVAALEAGRREGLHLGAQLYVSLAGRPVAELATGVTRPGGPPLTPDHLMLWLSATKPVAALAVAQLWENGLLALDDPVARHLPEFAAGGKERVTIRHLLTHTAGIRMLQTGWPDEPWEALIARVAARKLEPRWVPGEKAGYHQASSWFVLGELVRRLDGRRFEDYVREEIFLPLGQPDAWIGMPPERWRAYRDDGRLAPVFDTAEDAAAEGPRDQGWDAELRVTRPSPGGNGWGPMRSLGRFYEALLDGGGGLVAPQTVEAMVARHRAGLFDHTFQHVMDWGLGFIIDSKQYGADTVPYAYGHLCSRRTYGHSGFRSMVGLADPEHGLAVALAFNGTPAADAHEARVRRVLDALYRDLGLAAPEDAAGDDDGIEANEPGGGEEDPR
ncbi:MAG TPA: serine hydrolase domain-containing protein [Thermoanaerobaculia bacterium]|nr:serine hydrolase domain-containing protein [Thermoanaerobaculia bacterium]